MALGKGKGGSQHEVLGFWLVCLYGSMLASFINIGNIKRGKHVGRVEAICLVNLSSNPLSSKNSVM